MPDIERYDILVIGSGEAGKRLTWTLARSSRVHSARMRPAAECAILNKRCPTSCATTAPRLCCLRIEAVLAKSTIGS